MIEPDLRCNQKNCRKLLDGGFAWVTSCSHIFCEQDGERHFNQNLNCPACDTLLSNDGDFYKTNLTPNEQYKSMVLAGQKPEVIMDVCSKALTFWNYQISQEKTYYEWLTKKLRDQMISLEQQYKEVLLKYRNENQTLKLKLENVSQDLSNVQKRYDDLSEKYQKSRRLRDMSTGHECLQKKTLTPNIYESNTCQETMISSSRVGQLKRFGPVASSNFPALLSPYYGDPLKAQDAQQQNLSLRQTAGASKLNIFQRNPSASSSKFEFRPIASLKSSVDNNEKSSSKFNLPYSPFGGTRSHKSDPATNCSNVVGKKLTIGQSADKATTDENSVRKLDILQYKSNFLRLHE